MYSEEELKPFAQAVKTARAQVKKLYAYLNNHFAAQAVADADGAAPPARRAGHRTHAAELVERYPMLEGKVATLPRFTVALMMRSPTAIFCTTSMPEMIFPNTVYLTVELAASDAA